MPEQVTILENIIAMLQELLGSFTSTADEIVEAEAPEQIDELTEKMDGLEDKAEKAETNLLEAEKAIVNKMEEEDNAQKADSEGANADAEERLDNQQPQENDVTPNVLGSLEKARQLMQAVKTANEFTNKLLKSKAIKTKQVHKFEERKTKSTILKLETQIKDLTNKLSSLETKLEKSLAIQGQKTSSPKVVVHGQREVEESIEKSAVEERVTLRSLYGNPVLAKKYLGGKING